MADTAPEAVLPTIQAGQLKPYASLLVIESIDNEVERASDILWRIVERAARKVRPPTSVVMIASGLSGIGGYLAQGGVDAISGSVFQKVSVPNWAQPEAGFSDTTSHLALLVRRRRLFALHCSPPVREIVQRWLDGHGRPYFNRIPTAILQGAFLQGEAKVLWLRGAHTPRTTQPDSKTMAGRRLQDALSAIGDATFAMTSAKAALPDDPSRRALTGSVGTTPQKSVLWNRPTSDFDEFIALVSEVFDAIEQTALAHAGIDRPFPILANETYDLSDVAGAYDLAALPPETLLEGPIQDPDLVEAAYILERAVLEVDGTPGSADFLVHVGLDGAFTGTLRAAVVTTGTSVQFKFGIEGAPTNLVSTKTVLEAIRYGQDLITVYYDSGHSIADGRIISQQIRPAPFPGWDFRDFTGYDITREKPAVKRQEIHDKTAMDNDTSLFGWVVREFSEGYLTCDDGSGEVCDFLHVSERDYTLSFIHVKASSTGRLERGVAVGNYEIVASQAAKNLMSFDTGKLRKQLESPGVANPACWSNGTRVTGRQDFLDALDCHGPQDKTRVIIVQPHLTEVTYNAVRNSGAPSLNLSRLALLETLLNSAGGSVMALGGELVVIGSKA